MEPSNVNQILGVIPEPASVWLIGDYYHAWLGFEKKSEIDNDPEHQPGNSPIGRQPKYFHMPSGGWYVKRFLDRIWYDKVVNPEQITLSYGSIEPDNGIGIAASEPFALGTSTISYTLADFSHYPDSSSREDTVCRIKGAHGYCPAIETIERETLTLRQQQTAIPEPSEKERAYWEGQLVHLNTLLENYRTKQANTLAAFNSEIAGRNPPQILVVEDMDMGFRDEVNPSWDNVFTHFRKKEEKRYVVVLLGRQLPHWKRVDNQDAHQQCRKIWDRLYDDHAEQTVVVVNADLLRSSGANISRRISWERTAQDCVEALNRKKLLPLLDFAHVVVRFGVVGAIHCYKNGTERKYDLYYDTKARDGIYRDLESEGGVIGNNSVFASSIVKQLIMRTGEADANINDAISKALVNALPICQKLFREGYGHAIAQSDLDDLSLWEWPSNHLFDEVPYKSKHHAGYKPTHASLIGKVEVPRVSASAAWDIISTVVEEAERLQIASDIVQYGFNAVVNNPNSNKRKLLLPVAQFGSIATVDKDEIEGFRGISNVIHQYLSSLTSDPLLGPMSIAVFGPPGSGKSYTVREIIKGIDPNVERNFLEINMAQLTSSSELASYLLRVNDVISAQKTPLVFFDEFDCFFNQKLGWLKYFLGPMEGGTFKHPEEGVFRLGRGVFVFAGGTSKTYQEFESKLGGYRLPSEFIQVKGPDFLSRLRGHINIKGINQVHRENGTADKLYMFRRATILRSLLERT